MWYGYFHVRTTNTRLMFPSENPCWIRLSGQVVSSTSEFGCRNHCEISFLFQSLHWFLPRHQLDCFTWRKHKPFNYSTHGDVAVSASMGSRIAILWIDWEIVKWSEWNMRRRVFCFNIFFQNKLYESFRTLVKAVSGEITVLPRLVWHIFVPHLKSGTITLHLDNECWKLSTKTELPWIRYVHRKKRLPPAGDFHELQGTLSGVKCVLFFSFLKNKNAIQ